jgi:hypothetical protein
MNLFEEMANAKLFPTDVTFNALISACARRQDILDVYRKFTFYVQMIYLNSHLFASITLLQ